MILDIGCGTNGLGDVNVDLYLDSRERNIPLSIAAKQLPNFILADCYHLPFRNNAFNLVLSRHLIEHLERPLSLLKECLRVSKRCRFELPHRYSLHARKNVHRSFFSIRWFVKAMELLQIQSYRCWCEWTIFPFPWLKNIHLEIVKP